jgi:hypothetical protein
VLLSLRLLRQLRQLVATVVAACFTASRDAPSSRRLYVAGALAVDFASRRACFLAFDFLSLADCFFFVPDSLGGPLSKLCDVATTLFILLLSCVWLSGSFAIVRWGSFSFGLAVRMAS